MVFDLLGIGSSCSSYLMVNVLGGLELHRFLSLIGHNHLTAEKIDFCVGQNIRCLNTCPSSIVCPRFVLKVVC